MRLWPAALAGQFKELTSKYQHLANEQTFIAPTMNPYM
jgi:hypothetical protein